MPHNVFEKVLVANRGEIAVRIMRTLKRMGIKTVAVYSESDTNSLHVQYADEAIYIGPSPATESYLSIDNILSAIRISGAQAVHPGYGFLSENSNFANALRDEWITLIGPSVHCIKAMGDKIEAKKLAQASGVSTVPGYIGVIDTAEEAVTIAANIGFPVIVKAAAGGGGRGMRVIYSEDEVREAFRSATNEARSSFSDDRVFIEKFVEKPRHIEIQVLADKYGNVLCLGERECSIQRHHQKVIEEAPSPVLDEETRQKMYDQVISLVKKVGYYSAGTVEFILDQHKNFYFLEMNTRLQVEHCVTELITGIDIVEQMIRVAAGEKLAFTQEDIQLKGWAIESRIYAEDPARGFLPSSGRVTQYTEPPRNPNVRIDSGIYEGGEVSMFYDAMIAKLCTYAPTRLEAIKHMQHALGEFVIRGISHNISFLEAVMDNQKFIDGDLSTNFINEEYPEGFSGAELTSEITRVFLSVSIHIHLTMEKRMASMSGQLLTSDVRIGTRWVVNIDGNLYPVVIKPTSKGYNIRYERERLSVRSSWMPGNRLFRGIVNDKTVSIKINDDEQGCYLTHAGRTVKISVRLPRIAELERFMPVKSNIKHSNNLIAPLAGKVVAIKVAEGEEVKAGQELVLLEAMKMENSIHTEHKAIIKKIYAEIGENVSSGQVLIEFAEE
ncbi:Acetyl-/propionyl-coenzyme A carboxylase alpha chain [Rickettsiales bacterium Ac37b]|nr:Acetyl-/propionyl-coenzyme A carboxylase alpha chain [Rickettsiales bacterium Ac37b]